MISGLFKIAAYAVGIEAALLVLGLWNLGPCGPDTPIGMIALMTQLPFLTAARVTFPDDDMQVAATLAAVLVAILATISWAIIIYTVDFAVTSRRRLVRKFN